MKQNNKTIDQMKKRFMVHPCVFDGQRTLIYERGLEHSHPSAFITLGRYASENGYVIKEDQRADFIEGVKRVKNPSHANVISIMILTASLISQGVAADDLYSVGMANVDAGGNQIQIESYVDLEMSSFSSVEQLMDGLLQWVNQHTSFAHRIDHLPKLTFVNAQEIAEVAFGGKLPSAVDVKNLNILGLYNFKNETVYLLDSIDLETEEGKGILLHELVHYLQYEKNMDKEVDHIKDLEALAYSIEAKYINGQHI